MHINKHELIHAPAHRGFTQCGTVRGAVLYTARRDDRISSCTLKRANQNRCYGCAAARLSEIVDGKVKNKVLTPQAKKLVHTPGYFTSGIAYGSHQVVMVCTWHYQYHVT